MAGENLVTFAIDGISVSMNDISAQVVRRRLEAIGAEVDDLRGKLLKSEEQAKKEKKEAEDSIAKLTTEISNKDAKIATLEKQVKDSEMTPARLDALVKDRAAAIGKAKELLGDKLVVDGKSDAEIRRQVVEAKLGDAAKGWSDDQVKISFDTLTAGVQVPQQSASDAIVRSFAGDGNSYSHRPGPAVTRDQLDQKYAARDAALEKAWMHPNGAPAQQ